MPIVNSLLMLAGFVFAHATWNLSYLSKDGMLVPFAIVEKSGQRQAHRFVAESQEQAVAEGKAMLAQREQELA